MHYDLKNIERKNLAELIQVSGAVKNLSPHFFPSSLSIISVQNIPSDSKSLLLCRGNALGRPGWNLIMAAIEGHVLIEKINGVPCSGLVSGGMRSLGFAMGGAAAEGGRGEEEGLAAALVQYLPRSASCLTSLDLR